MAGPEAIQDDGPPAWQEFREVVVRYNKTPSLMAERMAIIPKVIAVGNKVIVDAPVGSEAVEFADKLLREVEAEKMIFGLMEKHGRPRSHGLLKLGMKLHNIWGDD